MSNMPLAMILNSIAGVPWVVALIIFVLHGHPWWAGACFFGAIFSGFNYRESKG